MSVDQRQRAREAFRRWHRVTRPKLPKCGARSRVTGEPCRQVAMANGRCHWHGGRTPKGDAWHKPRWPNGDRPDWNDKLNRKLHDHDRAAKKRAARLAKMSPEEREQHDAWQKAHRPGKASNRARTVAERKQAAELQASIAEPPPVSPEASRLQRQIEELERQRAELERSAAVPPPWDIFS